MLIIYIYLIYNIYYIYIKYFLRYIYMMGLTFWLQVSTTCCSQSGAQKKPLPSCKRLCRRLPRRENNPLGDQGIHGGNMGKLCHVQTRGERKTNVRIFANVMDKLRIIG
jgi:hypothetical protein